MDGFIKMLDVGDGDSIIVYLKKTTADLLIVIDGGRKQDYEIKVKPQLLKILNKTKKNGPDIVVATHYDADHIGGLIPLVKDYIDVIQEVWVHKTPDFANENDRKILDEYNSSTFTNIRQFIFESNLQSSHSYDSEVVGNTTKFLLESLKQLGDFLDLIPESKIIEVFGGYEYPSWPEVRVLGPTETYFNSLFKNINLSELISSETFGFINETLNEEYKKKFYHTVYHRESPCNKLKDEKSVKLTKTNKASIIFEIRNENKKLLFTGDAGIESFVSIPNYENELKNLYWLKIPHHGSDNNLSKEIIRILNPENAYNSGGKLENINVLNCISKCPRLQGKVRSTKEEGDLTFYF